MEDLPEVTRPNISEEVYRILRERFLSGQFRPGERLHLDEMQKQMQISRTPLKDALNRLAVEGLVIIKPRSGTFLAPLNVREVSESFDVRNVLELYAIETLAPAISETQLRELRALLQELRQELQRARETKDYVCYVDDDHKLHAMIVEFSGNLKLRDAWSQVNVFVQMARLHYEDETEEFAVTQKEHEDIMRALERRDPAQARAALNWHIQRSKQGMLASLAAVAPEADTQAA
jgi:DNA-binding GntR family transcriptional regulator